MLAEAYTNLYQFSMALYEIEKIDLTNMPDIVKLNIFLIKAKIKMIRGDLDGADLEFQNAHKIGEKTNDDWKHLEMGLYSGWAICQTEKGDYERVIEILEMGKQKRPNNLPFWNSIGCQYSLLGEHDKSLDAWEHAYKIDSREPNVLINLGLLYLRKNDDQTALKYYQKAKTSLEEGYEKFTEYEDGIPITKILLTLTNNAIRVITEGSNEDKEQLIIETGGKIQTKEEFYPLPDPPKKRKLEEYEEINIRCKRTIQNFIRKKYHADPEKFRKDFPSNYDEAKERFEEDDKKMNPQKDADLFTFIDTGVFPFIIRKKTDDWGLAMDCFNLVSMLYTNRDARNDQAHEMETTTRQKEIKFLNQLELIDFFEIKIMQ